MQKANEGILFFVDKKKVQGNCKYILKNAGLDSKMTCVIYQI